MRRFSALAVAGVCALLAGSALASILAAVPAWAATPTPGFDAPGAVAFDFVALGTSSAPRTVTITNNGQAPLSISEAKWFGPNPSDFKLTGQSCVGRTIAARGTCDVTVVFTPGAAGTRLAT